MAASVPAESSAGFPKAEIVPCAVAPVISTWHVDGGHAWSSASRCCSRGAPHSTRPSHTT